jgi:uncharacterized protein (TIGR03083 family)
MSLWDEPVRDVRPLAVADREQLLGLLADMTSNEWLTSTAVPGWTVKDIALHLLDDDLTWLSTQRDGDLSGLVDMSDRQMFPRRLAEKNQRWVDGARPLSRPVVTDLLRWTGEQLETLHAAQDLTGEGRVSWAHDDPVPYWFNLAQEFTERWVHQQQMREAVGRVDDHEAALPEVLRTFVWAFPHQLAPDLDVQCVEIAIDSVGVWTLTPDAGGWSFSTGSAADADAQLRLTANAAWRMLTGAAFPADELTAAGSDAARDALTSVRAIIV